MEKKFFTELELDMMQVLYKHGYRWISCDKERNVWASVMKPLPEPSKSGKEWYGWLVEMVDELECFRLTGFYEIKPDDQEPVKIEDYL